MSHTVTIQFELEEQLLRDAMTTFVESFQHDWFDIRKVKRAENLDVISAEIWYDDKHREPTKFVKHVVLDAAGMALAFQRLLDPKFDIGERVRSYVRRAVKDNEAGEIDSDAADCLVQALVFNELIYG